ncbi:MAG: tRNA (adenosine(37)-N6)-threonylcarbamoyltransferase complex transferase subunit TsaD [Terracidiphilus sp.]|jgi:N6-L-threonylcarbamoyladenine synthase
MPGSGFILGIESSCDETAAAIVERGSRTISSVVASQISTHARYGGVVPELASREHLRAIVPVVRGALADAHITLADLDAIAVTAGPGLAGALLVGITYAKALAFANQLPLIAVNHLEGHIHAVLLNEREGYQTNSATQETVSSVAKDERRFTSQKSNCRSFDSSDAGGLAQDDNRDVENDSALALVVSGGHTHLYLARPMDGTWSYSLVGRTLDDAAGEAFDKVAKLLGLGYPGGPWIDTLAKFGNPRAVPFSFAQIKPKAHLGGKAPRTKGAKTTPIARLDRHFLLSFSGIKTAVLRYVELHGMRAEARARVSRVLESSRPPQTREEALALCSQPTLDLIASFQHAVVGDLMKKTFAAAESLGARRVLVTGGVAANRELRERFTREAAARGVRILFPTLALSTDNAAMIAAAAWPRLLKEKFAPPDLSADPSLTLS